jgi:hypothetical protein
VTQLRGDEGLHRLYGQLHECETHARCRGSVLCQIERHAEGVRALPEPRQRQELVVDMLVR